MTKLKLDSDLIEGFQKVYLLHRFDDACPTPKFHREVWDLACSDAPKVAVAAPRGHAKSTGITLTFALALVLFKVRDFMLIVSDTEGQAIKFLAEFKVELQENEELMKDFRIKCFNKDTETEIEVEMMDGHKFCVIAKGSEQKVRGLKWRSKRPNAIIGDDLENDEIVLNKDRREKFSNWIFNALLPCGSKNCITRIVGTILHTDSFLERVLNDSEWLSRRYSAHFSFDDFSEILWPERYDEVHFRKLRQQSINQGKEDGYSQEQLNKPLSSHRSFFKKEWFKDYEESDYDARKVYYAACDFAISTKQRSDRTVIVVVGLNSHNIATVEQVYKGRWDAKEISEALFEAAETYNIEQFVVESGAIYHSIKPFLNDQMITRNLFLNLTPIVPAKDKETRAKAIQYRIKAGAVKFDKSADWWPDLEQEMLLFPRGAHDDQVDAMAYICLMLDKFSPADTEEEAEAEEWAELERSERNANKITGY